MKTLRKLFYVACTTFFLTSCEETYNDKLFWPGELSQEYGSYIKPSTLDLTYSGEKLIGKTVSFQTEDSKKGTLTLNDIIPGEKETSFRINLSEQEDNYTFSGETVSGAGATVKYAGSITPKTMKLDLNVTMPQNQWIKTYQMSELTRGRGKDVIRNQTTGEYEWGESDNQILTAALYTDMDLEMVKEAGSLYATVSVIIKGMGGYLLPQLLKSVTLESDGNITAEYTSDELQLGEQKFSEIDMDNPASQQQVINFIMMKLMFNTLSADDITAATQGRNYADSPRGLAFWYLKNDLLYVKLNLPRCSSDSRHCRCYPEIQSFLTEDSTGSCERIIGQLFIIYDRQYGSPKFSDVLLMDKGRYPHADRKGERTYAYLSEQGSAESSHSLHPPSSASDGRYS